MLLFIDFWTRLTQTNVIVGIILAILGVGLIFLASRIVRVYKKVNNVPETDHAVMIIRGFGLVLVLIAMFVMILY